MIPGLFGGIGAKITSQLPFQNEGGIVGANLDERSDAHEELQARLHLGFNRFRIAPGEMNLEARPQRFHGRSIELPLLKEVDVLRRYGMGSSQACQMSLDPENARPVAARADHQNHSTQGYQEYGDDHRSSISVPIR